MWYELIASTKSGFFRQLMSNQITKSSFCSCWHCKTRFSFVNLKLHNCTVPSEHISIGRNKNNFFRFFFSVKLLTNEKQLIGLVRPWLYYEYCTDLVFAVQCTQQLNLPDGIQHRVITTFQAENYHLLISDLRCSLVSFSSHFGNLVFGCFWQRSYQNIP